MRIGIDCRFWNETGVGRYIRNLIKYLQILDKRNDYILFVRKKDTKNIQFPISNFQFQIKEADIRWHSLEEQIKFPSILNKEKLDLVHFPYFSVPIFYKKPFIITIHDLILHNFSTGEASTLPIPLYKAKLLGYKFIISKVAKRAKKIIVPTNTVKEEVIRTLKIPKEKIEVTYEGVNEEISNLKSQNSKLKTQNYFLYVGNAYPHKNLGRLIEAFKEVRKDQKYKDRTLLLVGRDDYFYKRLEGKLSKEDSIKILHNVNDNELSYLYQNAIALVIPSLMEGFGLTALEAMSNKCLVLASDIPSFKEICGDAALYFSPFDTKDIESKMSKILDSNDRYLPRRPTGHYNELRDKGYDRSKLFSWEKMAKETLKIYESCISL